MSAQSCPEGIMYYRIIIIATFIMSFSLVSSATIINIPDDYRSIQQGIDSSSFADTVLIQPGVYHENIDFNGHSVALGSVYLTSGDTSYISQTIIDGDSLAPVLTITDITDSLISVIGLTLRRGISAYGGGIYCVESTPLISNCVFEHNYTGGFGRGAGIYSGHSVMTIKNCVFRHNYSSAYGGAIFASGSDDVIEENIFYDNYAFYQGGAIYISPHNLIIRQNIILNNTARTEAGAIYCSGGTAYIVNNTICKNKSQDGHTGGVSLFGDDIRAVNNIIWKNEPAEINGSAAVSYCCIRGGYNGANNSADYPLFVNWAAEDFNIYGQSPCLNSGDPDVLDPDGSRSDIGVFFSEHPDFQFRDFWHVSPLGNDTTGDGSLEYPFRSIQLALDFCLDGDTVLADRGSYYDHIYIYDKSFTLTSNYPFSHDTLDLDSTIISSDNGMTVMHFDNCDSQTVISGITVTGADTNGVAGIFCDQSNLLITNNVIKGNSGDSSGGIYCYEGAPRIVENVIDDNYSYRNGGGISCINSDPLVQSNLISRNSGGSENSAALYAENSDPVVEDNLFLENLRLGIYCSNSQPSIHGNRIVRNGYGWYRSGGVYLRHSNAEISGNAIWRSYGTGIFSIASQITLINNTICQNIYSWSGGGIRSDSSEITAINNIVRDNSSPQFYNTNGQFSATYCDISGGWEGEGNFDTNPLFVDPLNYNYNVCEQSPCIDAGDPSRTDPDGSRSDVGLYFAEHPICEQGSRWFVAVEGSDSTGDGSEVNPFRTIQFAIDRAYRQDTIIVRPGNYEGDLTVYMKDLVLASNYLISHDTLDISNTIISGDSLTRVVTFEYVDDATICGFTLQSGFNYDFGHGAGIDCFTSGLKIINNVIRYNRNNRCEGGGVYCDNSSLIIHHNVIKNNTAESGGGIYCYHSESEIVDNYITGNSIVERGGGIYTEECPDVVIRNNWLVENDGSALFGHASGMSIIANEIRSNSSGGIRMSDYDSRPAVISGNSIINNAADYSGGGVYCYNAGADILNNVIAGNSTTENGGGIYSRGCRLNLTSNSIANNHADESGGGIYCDIGNMIIVNSIIRDNQADYHDDEIYDFSGIVTATYSNISGGCYGQGNIDLDPLFRDPENSDYHLMASECGDEYDSPCIDAGDPDMLDSLVDCEHGLGTLISDMGAYGGGNFDWTDIEEPADKNELPAEFALLSNYPNPFNSTTIIRYTLARPSQVTIDIYDILGRRVQTLLNQYLPAGDHQVPWHVNDLTSGIYLYRIVADGDYDIGKMTLVK